MQIKQYREKINKLKYEKDKLKSCEEINKEVDRILSKIKQLEKDKDELIKRLKNSIDRRFCNSNFECENCGLSKECLVFDDIQYLEKLTKSYGVENDYF